MLYIQCSLQRRFGAACHLEQREDELVATEVVGMKRIFCVTLYSHDTCLWFNLARIIEYGCIQGM